MLAREGNSKSYLHPPLIRLPPVHLSCISQTEGANHASRTSVKLYLLLDLYYFTYRQLFKAQNVGIFIQKNRQHVGGGQNRFNSKDLFVYIREFYETNDRVNQYTPPFVFIFGFHI